MASPKAKKSKEKSSMSFGAYIRRYWQLYLLLLLPMLYLLIFKYIPMIYIQIAFKKYSIVQSVWKMPLAANHGFQYQYGCPESAGSCHRFPDPDHFRDRPE